MCCTERMSRPPRMPTSSRSAGASNDKHSQQRQTNHARAEGHRRVAAVSRTLGDRGGHFGAPHVVIGLISDTHGLLRPEAITALEGVQRIIHAGDIGAGEILDRLGRIAPVIAVRGNNDRDRWAASLPEKVVTEIAGARVCVIHDVKELGVDPAREGFDIVIAGHSHRPRVERLGPVLFLNPGSAGPRRFTLPISVGRLHLGLAEPHAEIVELDVAAARGRR